MKLAKITMDLHEICLHHELITRNNRTLELNVFHAAKQSKLAAVLFRIKHGNAADLCHSLQNQHARHNRMIRKMTAKMRLHHRDILDSYCRLERLKLNNAINEQHRRAMRQDLLNLIYIQYHSYSLFLIHLITSSQENDAAICFASRVFSSCPDFTAITWPRISPASRKSPRTSKILWRTSSSS